MKMRTLIVDDEALARPETDFEIIGECADGQVGA
jgi:hypothetical protein